MAAVAALMAIWWITEAVPFAAAALIPIAAFPLLDILPSRATAACYGDKNIYLLLGGFIIAIAMQRWNLHRRIALFVLCRLGSTPSLLVLGFMIATAFLSMWISNTATTLMMLPIALAVAGGMAGEGEKLNRRLGTCLMLAIAYSASIGGLGTLIGTPPNIVLAGALRTIYPEAPEIGFVRWMGVGLPLVIVFVPLTWLLLTRFLHPPGKSGERCDPGLLEAQRRELGPMGRGERLIMIVFTTTSLLWIFRSPIEIGSFRIPGWSGLMPNPGAVDDATVAVGMAILCFVLPVDLKRGVFLMRWRWAVEIPWAVLILFGGGFALSAGFQASGLDHWIGDQLGVLRGVPVVLLVAAICLLITFLTEVSSNTAVTNVMMPVLAATAVAIGVSPLLLMIPAAFSASCAFMLPVATPPNAIVFGSRLVRIPQMARAGVLLNLIGVVLITALIYTIAIPLFGIVLGEVPVWALP
jgi:sodium-dependent dicarboxylate transporter 2/3/5